MLFSQTFGGSVMDKKVKFQSPKTGLCYFHPYLVVECMPFMFCFNPLKRVYAIFTYQLLFHIIRCFKFQSPKTGLCYFHHSIGTVLSILLFCFNPLKRVYAIFTLSLLIAKNKKQYYCFYFPFNNLISPILIYRLFEIKMFGDNLQYFTKKYPYFHCKNTPIVPPHSGDSLPGFSHLPRLSPNSKI